MSKSLVLVVLTLLLFTTKSTAQESTEENYAPIYFIGEWMTASPEKWYRWLSVDEMDNERTALVEIEVDGVGAQHFRITYPCNEMAEETVGWTHSDTVRHHISCDGTEERILGTEHVERLLEVPRGALELSERRKKVYQQIGNLF